MIILLTGAAGFIGFHAAMACLSEGHQVIGVDDVNDYYAPALKQARLAQLRAHKNFNFHQGDLSQPDPLKAINPDQITHILHLAAQAGVRYSLENPRLYGQSNYIAHLEVLEFARRCDNLQHLVYASSSSVYGDRLEGPFSEAMPLGAPASLYAATKLGGEALAQSYSHLYDIAQTGLRFFTVYGPWGRPDMAYYIFTDKILRGEAVTLYAPEKMQRDFTYIDDIRAILPTILAASPQRQDNMRHVIYNLGHGQPRPLMDLVKSIEVACAKSARITLAPKQKGDVNHTFADIERARAVFNYSSPTNLEAGIEKFVAWYRNFHRL